MTDTPRTDEAIWDSIEPPAECVSAEFARQLERELNAALACKHAPDRKVWCQKCGKEIEEQQYAVNNFTNFIAGLGSE